MEWNCTVRVCVLRNLWWVEGGTLKGYVEHDWLEGKTDKMGLRDDWRTVIMTDGNAHFLLAFTVNTAHECTWA